MLNGLVEMTKSGGPDDVKTLSESAIRIVGLIALVIIIYIDAKTPDFEAKDIELALATFIAGSAFYDKVRERKK